jgi:hypothetical protein
MKDCSDSKHSMPSCLSASMPSAPCDDRSKSSQTATNCRRRFPPPLQGGGAGVGRACSPSESVDSFDRPPPSPSPCKGEGNGISDLSGLLPIGCPPRLALLLSVAFLLATTMLTLTGCAAKLPRYEWAGHEQAMAELVERAERIETIAGSCRIDLRQRGSGGTSLDGALAAQNPGYLRLRAWKFNHAAFDLTMRPDGVWLMTAEQLQTDGERAMTLRPADIARAWSLLSGEFFRNAQPSSTSAHHHTVIGADAEQSRVRSTIDRRTLVPLRFDYLDDKGESQASLILRDHRRVDEHIWPMRMTFESEHGRVTIQMRELEINREVAPAAFTPPRRAVRQP